MTVIESTREHIVPDSEDMPVFTLSEIHGLPPLQGEAPSISVQTLAGLTIGISNEAKRAKGELNGHHQLMEYMKRLNRYRTVQATYNRLSDMLLDGMGYSVSHIESEGSIDRE